MTAPAFAWQHTRMRPERNSIHGMRMHAACQASFSVASLCTPVLGALLCLRFCIDVLLQREESSSTITTVLRLRGKRHDSLCVVAQAARGSLHSTSFKYGISRTQPLAPVNPDSRSGR